MADGTLDLSLENQLGLALDFFEKNDAMRLALSTLEGGKRGIENFVNGTPAGKTCVVVARSIRTGTTLSLNIPSNATCSGMKGCMQRVMQEMLLSVARVAIIASGGGGGGGGGGSSSSSGISNVMSLVESGRPLQTLQLVHDYFNGKLLTPYACTYGFFHVDTTDIVLNVFPPQLAADTTIRPSLARSIDAPLETQQAESETQIRAYLERRQLASEKVIKLCKLSSSEAVEVKLIEPIGFDYYERSVKNVRICSLYLYNFDRPLTLTFSFPIPSTLVQYFSVERK